MRVVPALLTVFSDRPWPVLARTTDSRARTTDVDSEFTQELKPSGGTEPSSPGMHGGMVGSTSLGGSPPATSAQ